jgi:hypothetical protein
MQSPISPLEKAALSAFKAAQLRGMPDAAALNVAAAFWYVSEPFADQAGVRKRLSDLVGFQS